MPDAPLHRGFPMRTILTAGQRYVIYQAEVKGRKCLSGGAGSSSSDIKVVNTRPRLGPHPPKHRQQSDSPDLSERSRKMNHVYTEPNTLPPQVSTFRADLTNLRKQFEPFESFLDHGFFCWPRCQCHWDIFRLLHPHIMRNFSRC